MHPSAANIISLYRRHAQAWHKRRQGIPGEAIWMDRFTALLPAQAHVLDVGCGTGVPNARHIIGQGHTVTGVDTSPELLAIATTGLPDATWITADMRTLALDTQFAGILAWHSFFHLSQDDQRAMFAVFQRHAAPGAALMFTSGPSDGEAIGTFEGEPLYHASLDPDEYRSLLAHHGFAVIKHIAEDPDCGGATVWLAQSQAT